MVRRGTRADDVFWFIVEWKRKHDGNTPTLRQIALGCGMKAVSQAFDTVARLERTGRVRKCGRGLVEIVGGDWKFVDRRGG